MTGFISVIRNNHSDNKVNINQRGECTHHAPFQMDADRFPCLNWKKKKKRNLIERTLACKSEWKDGWIIVIKSAKMNKALFIYSLAKWREREVKTRIWILPFLVHLFLSIARDCLKVAHRREKIRSTFYVIVSNSQKLWSRLIDNALRARHLSLFGFIHFFFLFFFDWKSVLFSKMPNVNSRRESKIWLSWGQINSQLYVRVELAMQGWRPDKKV